MYYTFVMATLYRKYRSKRFDEIIGQDPIITTLTNQIKLDRIGHAYLFSGSRGTGKTSCARIFARAVNCLAPVNGSPCGECEVCKKLESPENVDIIEMDAASNNGVDDAREIRDKVKYLPVACRYKVYIIDEVHMLTGGAFNALLKTIEEPPDHVIFILATTEPQKLPQTIMSRCIRFDFRLVSTELLAKHVAKIYDAEGIKYTAEAAEEIARLGEGSVRDALSVADMLASAADVITPEIVLSLTGAGDSAAICDLFDKAAERDLGGCLAAADGFAKSGKSMAAVCMQLTEYARNVLVVKSVGRDKAVGGGLVNADRISAERMAKSAEKTAMPDIARMLECFAAAENGLKYSVNPRVYFETALVKLICGANGDDDLRKRVVALERKFSVNSVPVTEQKKNNVKYFERAEAANDDFVPEPPPAPSESAPVARAEQKSRQTHAPDAYRPAAHAERETQSDADAAASDRSGRQSGISDGVRTEKAESPDKSARRADDRGTVQAESGEALRSEVSGADEGEFMHRSAVAVSGMKLLGMIAAYLRKKDTYPAARARELMSRGVTVKERADAVAFVVPDESFLSMGESKVMDELNAALESCGIQKRARIEKTDEALYGDDLERAYKLFGRDGVVPLGGKNE